MFFVEVGNKLTGHSTLRGSFDTLALAEAYLVKEANKCRKFVRFQIVEAHDRKLAERGYSKNVGAEIFGIH